MCTSYFYLQEDMCSKRGLVENTDQQTFIMSLPRKLRQKYEQVLLPAQLEVGLYLLIGINHVITKETTPEI